jgi:hypothetical protein
MADFWHDSNVSCTAITIVAMHDQEQVLVYVQGLSSSIFYHALSRKRRATAVKTGNIEFTAVGGLDSDSGYTSFQQFSVLPYNPRDQRSSWLAAKITIIMG